MLGLQNEPLTLQSSIIEFFCFVSGVNTRPLDLHPNSGLKVFTVDSQETTEQSNLQWPCAVESQLNKQWLSSTMTLNLIEGIEAGQNRHRLEPSNLENSLIFSTPLSPSAPNMDVEKADTASNLGLKAPLDLSGLFNQGKF